MHCRCIPIPLLFALFVPVLTLGAEPKKAIEVKETDTYIQIDTML